MAKMCASFWARPMRVLFHSMPKPGSPFRTSDKEEQWIYATEWKPILTDSITGPPQLPRYTKIWLSLAFPARKAASRLLGIPVRSMFVPAKKSGDFTRSRVPENLVMKAGRMMRSEERRVGKE